MTVLRLPQYRVESLSKSLKSLVFIRSFKPLGLTQKKGVTILIQHLTYRSLRLYIVYPMKSIDNLFDLITNLLKIRQNKCTVNSFIYCLVSLFSSKSQVEPSHKLLKMEYERSNVFFQRLKCEHSKV